MFNYCSHVLFGMDKMTCRSIFLITTYCSWAHFTCFLNEFTVRCIKYFILLKAHLGVLQKNECKTSDVIDILQYCRNYPSSEDQTRVWYIWIQLYFCGYKSYNANYNTIFYCSSQHNVLFRILFDWCLIIFCVFPVFIDIFSISCCH